MEILMSTGAILVPADAAVAEQLLKHGGVEVKAEPIVEPEVKAKPKKSKVVTE